MRAREITIIVSLAAHGLIFGGALNVAHTRKARRATTVAIADEKKHETKKPEPPKPIVAPPKPKPVVARPVAVEAPVVVAPSAAAAASAPIATDIAMGNDVGMDMGTGVKERSETKPATAGEAHPKPGAATVKTPIHVDAPPPTQSEAGTCNEPPGKPEPTMKTDIEYTEEARAAGVEGRLVLEVTVDAQGNVTDIRVVNSVDGALDAAAIAIVKTWRFKPAMACGKPVAGGTYKIARRFELGD